MSERIDHAAEVMSSTGPEDELYALRHAVLALVEQQQIANPVAMAQSPLFNAVDGSNPALDALMEKTGGIAPDIAAALGIGGSDE